jgi:nucleoid DNA-binding protein
VGTINKTELAKAVAEETGLSNGQAKEAIEATLDQIANELTRGNEVSLPGFGKFAVTQRSARQGRNPQTGETIQIAASKAPRFQAAAPLKQALKA